MQLKIKGNTSHQPMVWFCADTHIYHKRMLEFRPYDSIEEMNQALLDNWNSVVGKQDVVFLLGDVSFADKHKTTEFVSQLNGKIHLIAGNHDKQTRKLDIFESVQDYAEIKIDDQLVICSHFPFLTWNKSHYDSWSVHGHCHGGIQELNKTTTRVDVGVDCWDYKPVSFTTVKELMDTKTYEAVDHHKNS